MLLHIYPLKYAVSLWDRETKLKLIALTKYLSFYFWNILFWTMKHQQSVANKLDLREIKNPYYLNLAHIY